MKGILTPALTTPTQHTLQSLQSRSHSNRSTSHPTCTTLIENLLMGLQRIIFVDFTGLRPRLDGLEGISEEGRIAGGAGVFLGYSGGAGEVAGGLLGGCCGGGTASVTA